jgi:hypothetical protein
MKTPSKQTRVLLLLLASALIIGSCGTHNKLSSASRPYYQTAKDQWKSGYHLAALYSATQGVLADRAYTNSKEFLYEHYDNTMQKINQELPKYENTKDTAEAVRRLDIYTYLVAINENIAKMKMPLKHHKNKWKWSAEAKDYTKEKTEAKAQAYDVFYNLAEKKLYASKDRSEVREADRIFLTGHNRYTESGSEHRQESLQNITNHLCDFADKHKDAETWQEVIMAADAFFYAKKYKKDSVRVYTGYEYTSKRLSKLLTEDAQRFTEKGDLESLLYADELYDNAITWNEDNEEAKKLKEELKPKIAEGYYQKAKSMDQEPNADLDRVKTLYGEAMKWVPDYKDSQARIYSVSVRNELATLEQNIDATQKEFDVVFERMKNVAEGINTANSVMDDITYVTENIRSLDKTLQTVSLSMKPLNLIPYVNVVSKSIDVSARALRMPVHRTAQTITPIEKKSVTPANKAVKKLKFYTDMTVQKMGTTQKTLINSKKTAASLQTCIHKVNDEQALKESEKAIIELNKGLVEVQKRLKDINNATNDLVLTANQIIGVSQFTAPVKGGIKSVKPAINEVKKVTNEIDKVLDKEFLGISARKALSVGGAAADMAMKAMEPLLKKMNINFPEIPGMAELEAEMAKFEEKYNVVKKTTDEYKKKYEAYSDVQGHINKNLNKLVEKTGCGVGVANFEPNDAVYKIKSPYSDKYWDISGTGSSTNKNGANVQLWSMDSGNDRKVKFIPAGGDAFYIEFQNGGRVLDVSGGDVEKGTNLQAWEKNGSGAQQFVIIPVDGKKDVFSIINVNSGKAVDASGGNTNKNGVNLHIWDFSESNKAQHWQFVKVSGKTNG